MDVGAVADDGIEQRSATPAVEVVGVGLAVDLDVVGAVGDAQLGARDAGEGLEGRAGRPPASRAVAVHGIGEFVGNGVAHGAAEAGAGKATAVCGGLVAGRVSHR